MASAEVWYVRSTSGGVHRLTLDELDLAFRAGQVSARSMVVPEAAIQWSRLGDLAGLDEATTPVVPVSERPVSMDLSELRPHGARRGAWRTGLCALALTIGVATGLGLRGPAFTQSLGRRAVVFVAGAKQRAAAWRAPRVTLDRAAASPSPPSSPAQEPRGAIAPPVVPEVNAAGLWTPIPYRKPELATTVPAIAATALPVARHEDRAGVGRAQRGASERRAAGRKSHARPSPSKSPAPASPDDQSGFTTGGNKYDPLNSGISP